jgi:hypothetical protein
VFAASLPYGEKNLSGTCPGHVPGEEQSGEPYTFSILTLKMKMFSPQINSGIVKTPFYFMILSL